MQHGIAKCIAVMSYLASETRYDEGRFNRCGASGLKLPAISLGLWHNFGGVDAFERAQNTVLAAFDLGITHFDLANNYGPPPGSAEQTFGRILTQSLAPYRDELIVSTKAGYFMWSGPYGDWGSRKYLVSSLDQSLARMGLDYVDIFYHHRPDPDTPLEETMGALDHVVRQGKALYTGISNYSPELTRRACEIMRQLGTPLVIHQPRYSMFDRALEGGLLPALEQEGLGCIVFSPLAQGLLSGKYLNGIPAGSRASKDQPFLRPEDITDDKMSRIRKLNEIARDRGQSLAQMAIVWVLRHKQVTSALIGASRADQVQDVVESLKYPGFTVDELTAIDTILH